MRLPIPPLQLDQFQYSSGLFQVVEPGLNQRNFLLLHHSDAHQFLITGQEIRTELLDTGAQGKRRQSVANFAVVEIPGDLIGEVAHQTVVVAELVNGGFVEEYAPAVFPSDALGHEAAPNIGHAEGTVCGQVEQGEGITPEGRVSDC